MTILPTLNSLRGYFGEDLTAGADYLDGHADRVDTVHTTVHDEASLLDWEGDTRDATVARTGADKTTALAHAELVRQAAATARDDASTLTRLAHNVAFMADRADEDGYHTDEDSYVVTPKNPSSDPEIAAAQALVAADWQAKIVGELGRFVAADTKVGGGYAATSGTVRAVDFTEPVNPNHDDIMKMPPRTGPPPVAVITMPDPPNPGFPGCDRDQLIEGGLGVVGGVATAAAGIAVPNPGSPLEIIGGLATAGGAIAHLDECGDQ